MLKKMVTALLALTVSASFALAGNVSPVTGPQDPSQLNNIINTLIVSGNAAWNPAGGASFLAANNISANATATITVTNLGAAGISPSTIVEWLRITNPSGHYRFIPMWGCSPGVGC